jgi:very-short-patch-repair endonuclease
MNRQTKLQDLGVKYIRFSDVDVKKNMNGVLSALKNQTDEVVRTSP